MVAIDQNNYYKIRAEMILLFQKYGALLINANKCAKEIDVSKGALENRRANGKGVPCIKFGPKINSPVRYRIDHVIAHKFGYIISEEMSKKLLLDILKTKPIELYSVDEAVALYDFEDQKMRRDLKLSQKRKKAVEEGGKVESYPLVAPLQSNESGTNYQFHRDNIIGHICGLTYVKTVSW